MRRLALVLLVGLVLAAAWFGVNALRRAERTPEAPVERVESGRARPAELEAAAAADAAQPSSAATETSREELAAEPGTANASDAPATLRVHVVAKEDGRALRRVHVQARPGQHVEANEPLASGGLDDLLTTDEEGRVTFTVPPGSSLVLQVNADRGAWMGTAIEEVDALDPGEEREVTVALVTGLDSVWYGRVVDGATGQPLAGARVERVHGDPFHASLSASAVLSAADGLVRLERASWREDFARVELDGYAPASARLLDGFSDPEAPFPVVLWKPATLVVRVQDHAGVGRAGVEVEVSYFPLELLQGTEWAGIYFDSPTWTEVTDGDGRAELAGLFARAGLTLELRDGARAPIREESALQLEPGERREIVRVLGVGCTIHGRTVEPHGRPAPGVLVWLLPADPDASLAEHDASEVTQRVASDASGRFTLMDVAAGEWLVGPAPGGSELPLERSDLVAPQGTRIVVRPEDPELDVDVVCWRGLFVSGVVLDPDGEERDVADVYALSESFTADGGARDGAFTLGPLVPGTYRVGASADGLSDSEPVLVEAGTSGVVLRLRRAAALRVRVLAADGAPAPGARIWALHEDDVGGWAGAGAGEKGTAELGGLLAGRYTLSASDRSGAFGSVPGVELRPGAEAPLVELRLEPAARVRLSVPEELVPAAVVIRRAGTAIWLAIPPGDTSVPVPPGELELDLVRWTTDGMEKLQSRKVVARLGEETVVEFDAP